MALALNCSCCPPARPSESIDAHQRLDYTTTTKKPTPPGFIMTILPLNDMQKKKNIKITTNLSSQKKNKYWKTKLSVVLNFYRGDWLTFKKLSVWINCVLSYHKYTKKNFVWISNHTKILKNVQYKASVNVGDCQGPER